MSESRGAIVIISGPSGSGKTTLVKRLLQSDPDLVWSVSATTRLPREGEVDGSDYRFLTRPEFERRIAEGAFAEYAESYGNLYGTPAAPLAEALDGGRVMILDIDVQGARQIRMRFPEAVLVFVKVPDLNTLGERLRKRRSENEEQFKARIERARAEMDCAGEYDRVISNVDLGAATTELRDFVRQVKEARGAEPC